MSKVHQVYVSQFVAGLGRNGKPPWVTEGESPLGYWLKDGKEMPFFNVLHHVVSGGGIVVGESTFKFKMKDVNFSNTINTVSSIIPPEQMTIVPIKDKSINPDTGQQMSFWTYRKSVRLYSATHDIALARAGHEDNKEVLKLFMKDFKLKTKMNSLEMYSQLYFKLLADAMESDDDGIKVYQRTPSFVAEMAAAYLMAHYGKSVPANAIPQDRIRVWSQVANAPERWFTNTCLHADRLIRPYVPKYISNQDTNNLTVTAF